MIVWRKCLKVNATEICVVFSYYKQLQDFKKFAGSFHIKERGENSGRTSHSWQYSATKSGAEACGTMLCD